MRRLLFVHAILQCMPRVRPMTVALLILVCCVCIVIYAAVREDRRGLLTVTFLDVGQGDAIYIDAPSGRQVLIDGGAGSSVLRSLRRVIPWYDRSIDMIVGTHPDTDHIGGLIDVLDRYRVHRILVSSVAGDTPVSTSFEEKVTREGAEVVTAVRGQVFDLGDEARLEILMPDRLVSRVETNLGCVVARLVYGDTSFMLPCDAPDEIERYLVRLDGSALRSNVLKAGHHGSKTSSDPSFVGYVDPEYAIYSRGCDNTFGHPNQETIDTFARFEIPTLDTCEEGNITFVSDGVQVRRN